MVLSGLALALLILVVRPHHGGEFFFWRSPHQSFGPPIWWENRSFYLMIYSGGVWQVIKGTIRTNYNIVFQRVSALDQVFDPSRPSYINIRRRETPCIFQTWTGINQNPQGGHEGTVFAYSFVFFVSNITEEKKSGILMS